MIRTFIQDEQGQAVTEYMLLVATVVVTVVTAAYTMIPAFQSGVQSLGGDLNSILDSGLLNTGDGTNR